MSTTSNILTLLAVGGAGAIALAILKATAAARAESDAKFKPKANFASTGQTEDVFSEEFPGQPARDVLPAR